MTVSKNSSAFPMALIVAMIVVLLASLAVLKYNKDGAIVPAYSDHLPSEFIFGATSDASGIHYKLDCTDVERAESPSLTYSVTLESFNTVKSYDCIVTDRPTL